MESFLFYYSLVSSTTTKSVQLLKVLTQVQYPYTPFNFHLQLTTEPNIHLKVSAGYNILKQ